MRPTAWQAFWQADYRAHDDFIAPARASAAPWRLCLGLVAGLFVFALLSHGFLELVLSSLPSDRIGAFVDALDAGTTPQGALFILFQLGLMIPATAFAARLMHKRGLGSLTGPRAACLRQFGTVLAALAVLSVVLFALPPHAMPGGALVPGRPLAGWIALLPLALLAVAMQCSAEEVLFRGYIQQQLAARFRSRLVWMLLPSTLFGAAHYAPGVMGENAIAVAVLAGLSGLLWADITARAGTLGPAIAMHVANNAPIILFVAPEGDLSGLALYTWPFSYADEALVRAWLPVDLGVSIVSWLTARLVLRR